jgi:hypothetical protein
MGMEGYAKTAEKRIIRKRNKTKKKKGHHKRRVKNREDD